MSLADMNAQEDIAKEMRKELKGLRATV